MKYLSIIIVTLALLACDWPFNTNTTTKDDVFELEISHNIQRVMPSAQVILTWNEITVENFKAFIVERMLETDTAWTSVVELSNEFLTSYIDTIHDDDDLLYRIGIADIDDNIIWANGSTSIPRTTSTVVPKEFPTIQPAFSSHLIDDGDTIFVNSGIYTETLGIAGKDVLIKSKEGYKATILQPTFTENPNDFERVLSIHSGILDGFTIELGAPSHGASGGGVALAQTGTVQNCYISGNQAYYGGGVFVIDDGNLYNNIISNNLSARGSGIYALSAHGEIINNTLFSNDIYLSGDCTGFSIINNIVYNSIPAITFEDESTKSGVTLEYSLFDYDIGVGENNIVTDPMFINNVEFRLLPNSPGIDAGAPDAIYFDVDGTRNDIGAYGGLRNNK